MSSLIWKEWREHRWMLAFGCLVLTTMALVGLHARIVPDATLSLWVCALGIGLLPILASTSLVPADRAEKTLEPLLALPISPLRILAVKTAVGATLCAGPLATACLATVVVAGGREMSPAAVVTLYAHSAWAALLLFAWMLALTVRLPTEARAAMIAVGVLVMWLLVSLAFLRQPLPAGWTVVSPLAFTSRGNEPDAQPPPSSLTALVQIAIALALWAWTARSFSLDPTADE